MNCDFTSFSTVFQSHQKDERLYAMEHRLRLRGFRLERDSSSGPLDLDVEVHFKLLIFQSKFSGPRKFIFEYQWCEIISIFHGAVG